MTTRKLKGSAYLRAEKAKARIAKAHDGVVRAAVRLHRYCVDGEHTYKYEQDECRAVARLRRLESKP